jgi:hypothetical protein
VSENKNGSWTLRVLLLACAGALLVIVVTLTTSIEEKYGDQRDATTIKSITGCEAVAHLKYVLPASQQASSGECTPVPETDLR